MVRDYLSSMPARLPLGSSMDISARSDDEGRNEHSSLYYVLGATGTIRAGWSDIYLNRLHLVHFPMAGSYSQRFLSRRHVSHARTRRRLAGRPSAVSVPSLSTFVIAFSPVARAQILRCCQKVSSMCSVGESNRRRMVYMCTTCTFSRATRYTISNICIKAPSKSNSCFA